MPARLTYPGVYVEEVSSGVRTITGVATSITAFIGRAVRGPVEEPVTINSYGDFERLFGGLWDESTLGFAVRDFYLNGGSQAVIVRLFALKPAKREEEQSEDARGAADKLAKARIGKPDLVFEAAHEGSWGNALRTRIDHDIVPGAAKKFGLKEDQLFNLTVRDTVTGVTEQFHHLTVEASSNRSAVKVLLNESDMVRIYGDMPEVRPAAHAALVLGVDPFEGDAESCSSKVFAEASDGENLTAASFDGNVADKKGIYSLEKVDLFNLLCIPPYQDLGDGEGRDTEPSVVAIAAKYCAQRRAMLLVDPPSGWNSKSDAVEGAKDLDFNVGTVSKNAALYFPRLRQPNPLRDNKIMDFAPCGAVAGVFARTDATRGVWKAPAGLEATLVGVPQLSVPLTDAENGELNPRGVNCLRAMPAAGRVVWGARTMEGDDRLASEWKYILVRRTALFIEESLFRGTQWVVFEPNDEPLWAQIRQNVGAFMNNLFRLGAFQGRTAREAYFVKCDAETTTQADINRGVVNIHAGFAPLKPAEFVVLKIRQIAGTINV